MKKKWVAIVLLFAGITIVTNQIFERVFHFSLLDAFQGSLQKPGFVSAASIIGLLAVDVFLPVPSSVVMILAGVLFGTVIGGLLSLTGSLIGNVIGFETMRKYGMTVCSRFVKESDIAKMTPVFEKYGAIAIVLSRPLPVATETLSLVAGLLRMPRIRFFLASVIGTLPISLLYAYVGTVSAQSRTILPATFVLVCVPAIAWVIVQRLRLR